MQFEIDWIKGSKEASASADLLTRCHLALQVNGRQLFRHEDLLGNHQVKNAIGVSAYPLAEWFAANWWRLRWEPGLLSNNASVVHDWKMSHLLAAAGEGYAWPNLTFASDGQSIQLDFQPNGGSTDSLRYLERLEAWVPAKQFESGVDAFIDRTLEQLNGYAEQTPLHQLWQTVLEERATPPLALQRQLEAKLGYDPEEAPEPLIALLLKLASAHGETAIQELACIGYKHASNTIEEAEQVLTQAGDLVNLPMDSVGRVAELLGDGKSGHPWEKARDAANEARQHLGLSKGPLNNQRLSELLGTTPQFLENNPSAHRLPIGLGEVTDSGRARIALGKTRKDSRRFMTARLIADGIYAGETGSWLPCTNAATARQKFQRAFAQEFLCPYNDLIEWMDTTSPDEEAMEAAAEHFEVSPLMINTVMVIRGHIPPSELDAFQQAV